jgi:hypothetical protein
MEGIINFTVGVITGSYVTKTGDMDECWTNLLGDWVKPG